mgnify:FL=1
MNNIEEDIYRAIDMAFHWFKKNNPSLEIICDEETMKQWYDFVTWCYAQDGECHAEDELKNNPNFNFEISPLMENAMSECDGWWCKYNVDHQEIAEEDFGDDEDEEAHWEAYEDAFDNISSSVDTSSFEKLSKIVL